MKLDVMTGGMPLRRVQQLAADLERSGHDGVVVTESGRTAFLSCAAASLAADIEVMTGIAVAFPRSPMVTAGIAWELAASTNGRFVLGLGSQVKAHIERRYSAEFAPPGPRMKEYVESVKAIFRAFAGEEPLSYEGQYYHFSLLPPTWSPGPIEVPAPPVYISAVLPYMSRLVGEVADGIHVHPFHSPEYVKDVQRKAIEEGLARSGRSLDEITFSCPIMTAVGDDDEELERTREHARMMIAFYGSTRTYSPVFEHHGYEGLSNELHALQKRGDVAGMKALVSDEILAHYTVTSSWNDLPGKLVARYRDLAPNVRVTSYTAADGWSDPAWREKWSQVTKAMRDAD